MQKPSPENYKKVGIVPGYFSKFEALKLRYGRLNPTNKTTFEFGIREPSDSQRKGTEVFIGTGNKNIGAAIRRKRLNGWAQNLGERVNLINCGQYIGVSQAELRVFNNELKLRGSALNMNHFIL